MAQSSILIIDDEPGLRESLEETVREIAIRCPITGLPVGTGETIARLPIPHARAKQTLRSCPACSEAHEWLSRDAWLIDLVAEALPDNDRDPVLI